ncbi:PLP-dependent cysteine synthase family protein [Daejeonella sp.]|uniref:PLP-dependent cysteine synthase family protein n=1 Tax=Daejeonella sp. TaxID=2805397 RepID=UPI00272142DC|nr:cysteine synthase family protein [Daejeonella sp.]MDO8993422.1 cysteine synthase family protein [Daejeonella sp.]MDP2414395.1 cysteine synthase family protein [Daejeonella sp.]
MGTLNLIHNTPLIFLDKISADLPGKIYAKAEHLQPGGSVKDRAAYQIILDAYENGSLKRGQTVVEMTSGNMGAGLALVCRQFGNPFVAVMSEGNSPERRKILSAFGAELILTKQVDGSPGMVTGADIALAIEAANEITQKRNAFYADQFNNPSCIKAHFNHTGPEILRDLPEADVFIASVGSGGTFIGTSKYLKSVNPGIKCIAVEPESAAILKTGKVNDPKHIIQGTAYGLIPPHWDEALADDFITVSDEEVMDMKKRLSSEQGFYVGYSAAANVIAAQKYLLANEKTLNIVTILCDSGYKYCD